MYLNNEICGYYTPSFFYIVLKTTDNISEAMEECPSTFVHEFIHYLQDLILPYNIRINLSNLRWFWDIRQSALKQGSIIRPFTDWGKDSETLILQYNYTMGINASEAAFVNVVSNSGDVKVKKRRAFGFDAGYTMREREFDVYTYCMPVNDGSCQYNLGARDLLEYIAYKIEKKHYPITQNLPQLPYESVDLLFEHYGLSCVSEDIRLCIAECCLYNDNPIRFLFVNFLHDENTKQVLKTMEYHEVYKKLLSLTFVSTDDVKETLTHKTHRRLQQFADQLTNYYAGLIGIKEWILKVNCFAEEKLADRFIFSDMYKMDYDELSNFINEIICTVGLPLIMNESYKCISLQSSEVDETVISQFVHFYILQRFLEYARSDKEYNICPVYHFCKANGNVRYKLCKSNPSPQIGDCLYGNFLHLYGLSDVAFE